MTYEIEKLRRAILLYLPIKKKLDSLKRMIDDSKYRITTNVRAIEWKVEILEKIIGIDK